MSVSSVCVCVALSFERVGNNHLCNRGRLTVTLIRNERREVNEERKEARKGEKTCKREQSNSKEQVHVFTVTVIAMGSW